MTHSYRTFALFVALVLLLGVTSIAAAHSPVPYQAATATPIDTGATATPIDSGSPVKLEFGKPFVTPLNNNDLAYAYFTFKGKANQLVTVAVQKVSGNYGITARVKSQNDVDLASVNGGFLDNTTLTVKLPQDGNYGVIVSSTDPGSGDLEPGDISVKVDEAKPAAAK